MTEVSVEKVPGGYRVDGLVLLGGKCGCGGLTGAGDCCQTYSVVRKDNNLISFFAKGTTANTSDNFKSGYRVKKPQKIHLWRPLPAPALCLAGKGLAGAAGGGRIPGRHRHGVARMVSERRIL